MDEEVKKLRKCCAMMMMMMMERKCANCVVILFILFAIISSDKKGINFLHHLHVILLFLPKTLHFSLFAIIFPRD